MKYCCFLHEQLLMTNSVAHPLNTQHSTRPFEKNFPFLQTNQNNIAVNGGKHKNWDLDGGEDSQLSLTDQLANVVGDMKVGRVADELDMLVAKVAEEVTDTVQTSVEMAGLKCV